MLQAGQTAPLFTLPDADMESVNLAKYRGKQHVVLYFYPRDGTPGCTIQATEFSDHEEEFARHHCVVLGVSPDDCLRHAEFRDANGVSIRLLADPEGRVCERYGVLQPQPAAISPAADGAHAGATLRHGHAAGGSGAAPRLSVARATFVIDMHGTVRHALHGVSPKGHAMQVLELVKALGQ